MTAPRPTAVDKNYYGLNHYSMLNPDKSNMYYESHVTIDPVPESRLEAAEALAGQFGFRLAKLLMQKRPEDTPERSMYDTFMTAQNTSYADIRRNTISLGLRLNAAGFKVRRYKIEDTLLDSRERDVFALLQGD